MLRLAGVEASRGRSAVQGRPATADELADANRQILIEFERTAAALQHLAVGFQRLDRDLVALTSVSQQQSSLLAKLMLGHQEMAETLREHARLLPQRLSSLSMDVPRAGVLAPLAEIELLPALLSHSALKELTCGASPWCVLPEVLPKTDAALPRLIAIMTGCRAALRHPDRLLWIQPRPPEFSLAPEEMEQVLGLVAAVDGIKEVDIGEERYLVAAGTIRQEAVTTALRWSITALDELHHRTRPAIEQGLHATGLADGLHAIDLPDADQDFDAWAATLPSLAGLLCGFADVPVGVVLPVDFQDHSPLVEAGADRLRAALREAGLPGRLDFQWVRGAVPIERSMEIIRFARDHEIAVDLTATERARPESRLAAYNDTAPYRPVSFDLRLPSFAPPGEFDVIEIPRWSGRNLRLRTGGRFPTLSALFDGDFAQACGRLAPVLDRAVRRQYEAQANLDRTLVPYWADYFVYNWAPPEPATMRVIEFDGAEVASDGSPLVGLQADDAKDPRRVAGRAFLDEARRSAGTAQVTHRQLRSSQVEEHLYLREREDVTPDAARLIDWMPAEIGTALELGSGYGLMARRVQDRATHYIGCELSIAQGAALRDVGASAFVADLHSLPMADASVDTIIADNVIEHAYDPLQALREWRRVLRPKGAAFLIIPNDYRSPAFSNRTHYWKADERSAVVAFRLAGFRLVRTDTVQLAELGVRGAFPSSQGTSTLWYLEAPEGSS